VHADLEGHKVIRNGGIIPVSGLWPTMSLSLTVSACTFNLQHTRDWR